MSIQFSDTTNRDGLIQMIEDRTGAGSASASSYPLGAKTRDINSAFARLMSIAVKVSGRWQVDDTNQTDYPIVLYDVVTSQQDYAFVRDGSSPSNQVLDIHRIEIKDNAGNWKLLVPIDEADIDVAMTVFESTAGVPEYYDKTSNAIFLYPKPNYDSANGLKFYFSRTPSYFLTTDTTKTAGIPDMFHEYLALRPSYLYCLSKGLPQASALKQEVVEMEESIRAYYGSRQRDERSTLSVNNSGALDNTDFSSRGRGVRRGLGDRGVRDWR